jgi:hypothetical protein
MLVRKDSLELLYLREEMFSVTFGLPIFVQWGLPSQFGPQKLFSMSH